MMEINEFHVFQELLEESDEVSEGDTSSDSDEENYNIVARIIGSKARETVSIPRTKDYLYRNIPGFCAETFKSHFRVNPSTFDSILQIIGPQLKETGTLSGRKPIPPKEQLLITLWIMATPDSYRSVSEKFDIPKTTAIRAVNRVTNALYCLAPKVITWPKGREATKVMQDFEKFSAFPKVIGAIDGTHVRVYAPEGEKQELINRKGYASIQLQAVCQHDCKFISVFAGYAGSVHDARVFRCSPVVEYLGDTEYFPDNAHLIGDAAYGIHPNIMVPFKDNGHLTARQKNFNFCLSSARMSIERAFGLWKARWRRVRDYLHIIKMKNIPKFLLATCVLHNICIMNNDFVRQPNNLRLMSRSRLTTASSARTAGNVKRQQITDQLIIRNN